MVLQNKFKARASRRYHAQKGESTESSASGSKPRYRHKQVRRNGAPPPSHGGEASESSDVDSEDSEEEGSVAGTAEDQVNGIERADPNFPSLAQAAASSGTPPPSQLADDPANPTRGKYARRKLGESNLARLERLEAERDPHLADEEEPEPEVDLTNLLAKVAALGESGATQAGIAEEIARHRAKNETASDVENDIDHTLAYLHDKEHQRQVAKGHRGSTTRPEESRRQVVDAVELDPAELEEMQRQKEKAEAVRTLKARFQGRALGEREAKSSKSRNAPSLNIGPAPSLAQNEKADAPTLENGNLSASLANEIESSLAKTKASASKSDTLSAGSGRSTFSTSFGRRKSPLKSALGGASTPDHELDRSAVSDSIRIDSFLASLNDRSVGRHDPSIFTLGGGAPHSRSRAHSGAGRGSPQIHSKPGELSRMENFLDDVLG
ncbi:hypothetical protein BCV70DRAFT_73101 [Testicularia cyperi]|uniref:Uncharacterized protein n=1 Tax=Testicularia cyperi TaxID=1882483 RepID=A0A317XU98_9BASI|nr:hypothetical protein BCV70DRAFT_73101 [Testicularia cyperi]